MSGSHLNWAHLANADPSANNGQNFDWATMARQWVEIQQQQQQQQQQPTNLIGQTFNISEGVQMAAPIEPLNNFVSPYQAYDPYLQQQIMHQQILAAAQWATSNQPMYTPSPQYFFDSHLHPMQHATSAFYQYNNANHNTNYAPPNQPPYTLHNTQSPSIQIAKNTILPLSSPAVMDKSLSNKFNEDKPSEAKIVDFDKNDDQSKSIPNNKNLSSDSLRLSEHQSDHTSDSVSECDMGHVQKTTAKDSVNQLEKRLLEPYRKKPISAMTINKSSASHTSSKPVCKIPPWIREGLERIERERARKLEKERQEALMKEMDEDSSNDIKESQSGYSQLSPKKANKMGRSSRDQSSDEADDEEISQQTPFIRDKVSVSKDLVAILASSRPNVSDVPKKLPEILMQELKYPNLRRFMDGTDDLEDEERDQMLNGILRQALTKLLLEETNHMIESTCSEIYEKFREQSAVCNPSQTTGAADRSRVVSGTSRILLMNDSDEKPQPKPLGYLIDYDSDSSADDEDTVNDDSSKDISKVGKSNPHPLDKINPQKDQSVTIESTSLGSDAIGGSSSQNENVQEVLSDEHQMSHAVSNKQMKLSKDNDHERRTNNDKERKDSRRDSKSSRRRSRSRNRGLSSNRSDDSSKESRDRKSSRSDRHRRSRSHDRSSSARYHQQHHHRHGKDRHDRGNRHR